VPVRDRNAELVDEIERIHLRALRRRQQLLREIAEVALVDDVRRRLDRRLQLMVR
jgi:hypothetical protein